MQLSLQTQFETGQHWNPTRKFGVESSYCANRQSISYDSNLRHIKSFQSLSNSPSAANFIINHDKGNSTVKNNNNNNNQFFQPKRILSRSTKSNQYHSVKFPSIRKSNTRHNRRSYKHERLKRLAKMEANLKLQRALSPFNSSTMNATHISNILHANEAPALPFTLQQLHSDITQMEPKPNINAGYPNYATTTATFVTDKSSTARTGDVKSITRGSTRCRTSTEENLSLSHRGSTTNLKLSSQSSTTYLNDGNIVQTVDENMNQSNNSSSFQRTIQSSHATYRVGKPLQTSPIRGSPSKSSFVIMGRNRVHKWKNPSYNQMNNSNSTQTLNLQTILNSISPITDTIIKDFEIKMQAVTLKNKQIELLSQELERLTTNTSNARRKNKSHDEIYSFEFWSEQQYPPQVLQYYLPLLDSIRCGNYKMHKNILTAILGNTTVNSNNVREERHKQYKQILEWLSNLKDSKGNTMAHYAVLCDELETSKKLIRNLTAFGCKLDSINKDGKSPLDLSVEKHQNVTFTKELASIHKNNPGEFINDPKNQSDPTIISIHPDTLKKAKHNRFQSKKLSKFILDYNKEQVLSHLKNALSDTNSPDLKQTNHNHHVDDNNNDDDSVPMKAEKPQTDNEQSTTIEIQTKSSKVVKIASLSTHVLEREKYIDDIEANLVAAAPTSPKMKYKNRRKSMFVRSPKNAPLPGLINPRQSMQRRGSLFISKLHLNERVCIPTMTNHSSSTIYTVTDNNTNTMKEKPDRKVRRAKRTHRRRSGGYWQIAAVVNGLLKFKENLRKRVIERRKDRREQKEWSKIPSHQITQSKKRQTKKLMSHHKKAVLHINDALGKRHKKFSTDYGLTVQASCVFRALREILYQLQGRLPHCYYREHRMFDYNRKLIDEKIKIECSSIDDAQATCHYSLTDVIPNILSHEFIHNLTVMYDFIDINRTGMIYISNIAVYYQSCIACSSNSTKNASTTSSVMSWFGNSAVTSTNAMNDCKVLFQLIKQSDDFAIRQGMSLKQWLQLWNLIAVNFGFNLIQQAIDEFENVRTQSSSVQNIDQILISRSPSLNLN